MKIAVIVKQVPDTETKAKLGANGLDMTGVKFILNPYDEFAVEEAIKTKTAAAGSTITVFTLGPDRSVEAMRTALAMGCDAAVHIKVSDEEAAKADSYLVAKALAKTLEQKGPFDLVFAGKQAIDDDALAVPQMVAEFLGWGRATVVSSLEVSGDKLVAKRSADGGNVETYELAKPALIAANKGLNTPRYASLPGIMKAKKVAVDAVSLSDLGLSIGDAKVEIGGFEVPPEKSAGKMFTGSAQEVAAQIVKALREEAKVI
ncbi:MAG TPA: electron transfer flavoprotein subunit beta/FixA family protein [Bdellovibrionota bacterium]|jgi:electron transfer flavoprotein beta subunit|nr:electron transfer flavoprotein subunit beta/FixA family protein [Bdellovibrionota bacterium]